MMRMLARVPTFILLLTFANVLYINYPAKPFPSPSPPHILSSTDETEGFGKCIPPKISISPFIALRISILCIFVVLFLIKFLLWICTHITFIEFSTNLSTKQKRTPSSHYGVMPLVITGLYFLLLSEHEGCWCFLLLNFNWNLFSIKGKFLRKKHLQLLGKLFFLLINLYIFDQANNPCSELLSLTIIQNSSNFFLNSNPTWLPLILIKLSNNIHVNPGPSQNAYFTFMNWNCNSIAKDDFHRLRLLEAENSIFNYGLISLCETSLNDQVKMPDPDTYLNNDYKFIPSNKPDNTRHGGVGLFYKNSLPLKVRNDLSFAESIVVELNFGRKKIFFTVLYRSPSYKHTTPEFANFISNLTDLYTKIKQENPYMTFFTGDFNGQSQLWYPDGITTPEGNEIENLITNLGLHQVIREPTNFEINKKPTCIDLVITDQPNLILNSGTRPSPDTFCHHQIIHCKANFNLPPAPSYEREMWHYHRANRDLIRRSMENFPWERHFSLNSDPTWQIKEFNKIFLNIMSNSIPHEIKKIIPRDSPWITKPLKAMIRQKNRLYQACKRHGFQANDQLRLNNFRDECRQAIEAAKNNYLATLGNKLHNSYSNGKVYWKILKKVINKSKAPKVPPLLVGNKFIVHCKEKAKLFTTFFCKQCTPIITNSVLPALFYKTDKRIDQILISTNDIVKLISNLNPNKATGSDSISAQMLLLCGDTVASPLKVIFTNILSTGIYPESWKLADVTPIHKKDDKQLIENYRPISLLPICSKIFEKLVFNHLYGFLTENNLITKNQSGFRPGDSTTNQLLDLIDTIHQSFDASPTLEVRAVFMDISKAFDKVWHEGLIFKLKQNGVSGTLLKLFQNYLNNRKQRVVLNGMQADYDNVKSGVPQGSVLGPLLFLIYINDLEENIKSQVRFFADDTMLYSIVKDPNTTANNLNEDLETICRWAQQWKMEFNPDPSKQATELLFSTKSKPPNHPPLIFNGTIVSKVNEQKHLGLILDRKLTFKKHIEEKIKKTKKTIGMIKHLSKFLPIKTLILMYKALVRPHFDYCDVIFHIPPSINSVFDNEEITSPLNSLMAKIESVQYQAALAITGAWQGTSRLKLYNELGFESLSDRRSSNRILQLFKIKNNQTPAYLRDKLTPLSIQNIAGVNPNVFDEKANRTLRYKNSFLPSTILAWNNIITGIGNLSKNSIKTHILKLIRPICKSLYDIHDPNGLRYLFQLRTELSPLRSHKHRHNFQDTPTDNCICNQGIEDTYHFLFSCRFSAAHRAYLAVEVTSILRKHNLLNLANDVDLYLYGNNNLPVEDNKKILLATIEYIKRTKRFAQDIPPT